MTRKQIESEYKVINGVIRSPGKFEAEPVYAPYFYDAMMNGDGDYDEEVTRISIEPEDLVEFPELAGYETVLLEEDSNGFAYVSLVKES